MGAAPGIPSVNMNQDLQHIFCSRSRALIQRSNVRFYGHDMCQRKRRIIQDAECTQVAYLQTCLLKHPRIAHVQPVVSHEILSRPVTRCNGYRNRTTPRSFRNTIYSPSLPLVSNGMIVHEQQSSLHPCSTCQHSAS